MRCLAQLPHFTQSLTPTHPTPALHTPTHTGFCKVVAMPMHSAFASALQRCSAAAAARCAAAGDQPGAAAGDQPDVQPGHTLAGSRGGKGARQLNSSKQHSPFQVKEGHGLLQTAVHRLPLVPQGSRIRCPVMGVVSWLTKEQQQRDEGGAA